MEFDNAWVLEALEDSDFALCRLALHWVLQSVFFVNFHRILFLVSFIQA